MQALLITVGGPVVSYLGHEINLRVYETIYKLRLIKNHFSFCEILVICTCTAWTQRIHTLKKLDKYFRSIFL